jgi:hypothetical protein
LLIILVFSHINLYTHKKAILSIQAAIIISINENHFFSIFIFLKYYFIILFFLIKNSILKYKKESSFNAFFFYNLLSFISSKILFVKSSSFSSVCSFVL